MKQIEISAAVCVLQKRIDDLYELIDAGTRQIETSDKILCFDESQKVEQIIKWRGGIETLNKSIDWLKSNKGGRCMICESELSFEQIIASHKTRLCNDCVSIVSG